jgi:hypothetical protein
MASGAATSAILTVILSSRTEYHPHVWLTLRHLGADLAPTNRRGLHYATPEACYWSVRAEAFRNISMPLLVLSSASEVRGDPEVTLL